MFENETVGPCLVRNLKWGGAMALVVNCYDIFINDTFFFVEKSEICNCADDNTIYS